MSSNVESFKIFINNKEVVSSGIDVETTDKNRLLKIEVIGNEDYEVQEVTKEELKEIDKALKDDKKKVMIENGKPRIRLLDDKGKIK